MAKRRSPIEHAEIVKRFATKLRELRISRGLTQAEVAHAAQITASYVWRLESGGAAPGIDLVERLAVALGTSVHELLPSVTSLDSVDVLRGRANALFKNLLDTADRETLLMLCPLLARLAESPTRRR